MQDVAAADLRGSGEGWGTDAGRCGHLLGLGGSALWKKIRQDDDAKLSDTFNSTESAQ